LGGGAAQAFKPTTPIPEMLAVIPSKARNLFFFLERRF